MQNLISVLLYSLFCFQVQDVLTITKLSVALLTQGKNKIIGRTVWKLLHFSFSEVKILK